MGVDKPRNDRHTRQVENLCAIGGVELAFRPDVDDPPILHQNVCTLDHFIATHRNDARAS